MEGDRSLDSVIETPVPSRTTNRVDGGNLQYRERLSSFAS